MSILIKLKISLLLYLILSFVIGNYFEYLIFYVHRYWIWIRQCDCEIKENVIRLKLINICLLQDYFFVW